MTDTPETDDVTSESTPVPKTTIDAVWSVDHEHILVEWADKSMCMRLLHAKATASYSRRNMWYTLPVIVMSTLAGAANFSQERVPEEYRGYFSMGVGLMNIIAGIITTVQQFLKITQLNEAHRVSSIAWDKFYRNIKTELAKHPKERLPVVQFLKMCKEEYDRLMETSPMIPEFIVNQFNITFDPSTKKGQMIKDIAKPEICDVLVPTEDARNLWYTEENMEKQRNEQFRNKMSQASELKRLDAHQMDTVRNFKKMFFDLNNRDAMDQEVVDNLGDAISHKIIKDILRRDAIAAQTSSERSLSIESSSADSNFPSHAGRAGSTNNV